MLNLIRDNSLTINHVSPQWVRKLRKAGLAPLSHYTWFANCDTVQLQLRCYPMDEYGYIRNSDAMVARIQRCEIQPAYSVAEMMQLIHGDVIISKEIAPNREPLYSVQVNNLTFSEPRLPDALASFVFHLIGHKPETLNSLNTLLAALLP